MAVPGKRLRADDIALQLCEPREAAFTRDGWYFELKLDGFRLLAAKEDGTPRLVLRRGRDATKQFPEIAQALEALAPRDFILDGELVIQDERGHPIFQRLLNRSTLKYPKDIDAMARELPAVYFAFDLLMLDGQDLRGLPLKQRKELLAAMLGNTGRVRLLDHIEREGEALLAEIKRRGLEGVVAKKADAPYRGDRNSDWQKIALKNVADFAVVGWAGDLGALHLAVHDGKGFVYAGKVGSGLNPKKLQPYVAQLEANELKKPACRGEIDTEEDDRWTKPELVVEVRYKNWPPQLSIREPAFLRFREDKLPHECPPPAGAVLQPLRPQDRAPTPAELAPASFPLSNPDKVLWPEDGITKRELYEYYRAVSPWLLPYLKSRPLMLTRYPDGIHGKNFFQRALPKKAPEWVHFIHTTGPDGPVDQIVCDDLRTLEWLANLAAIPLHVPAGRVSSLDLADWCVIDFDPKKAAFEHVIILANGLHQLCEEIGLPTYVKTTGSSGLHVLIPLDASVPHLAAVTLAEVLAAILIRRFPQFATVERVVEKRANKVYLDCWQNGQGKLIAAPLCVRPLPGAPVSMPLEWDEVGPGLTPRQFTIRNAVQRLHERGDPFAKVRGPAAPLEAALEKLGVLAR